MSPANRRAFLVEPVEPLLFGPPRSLSAGEAHRIRSQFPPPPTAFQGMIRSRLLLGAEPALDLDTPKSSDIIAELVGTPSELPPGWQIRGPFPARWRHDDQDVGDDRKCLQPWVPTPRFLLGPPADPGYPLHAREISSPHECLSDLAVDTPRFLGRPDRAESRPLNGWIGPANLRFALGGESGATWQSEQWGERKPDFVKDEFQPGLAIDKTESVAKHGLLYFAEALRFDAGSGLFGQLETPELLPPLSLSALTESAQQAGRRGRLARFRAVERLDSDWEALMRGAHLPDRVDDGQGFWLVSMTPARIEDPLSPRLIPTLPAGVQVRWQAALTGRPFPLGGYEVASSRPRPNRLYVPGGSAWFFHLRGGTPETRRDAIFALHDRHTLGVASEAAMGFGHTVVGLGPLATEERR